MTSPTLELQGAIVAALKGARPLGLVGGLLSVLAGVGGILI
jgi:hypothetical protein